MREEWLSPAQLLERERERVEGAKKRFALRCTIYRRFGSNAVKRAQDFNTASELEAFIVSLEMEEVQLAKERTRAMANPLWGQF